MTQQAQQPDIEVTLTLKLSAVQTIAAALDEIPGKFGRPIFDEISRQVSPQVQSAQAAPVPTSTDAPAVQ